MENAVISKKEFLESINKDQFMSGCLRTLVEVDQKYCASVKSASRQEIEKINADTAEKKRKRSRLQALTEEQKRQVLETETLSVREKEKIIQDLQQKLTALEQRVEHFLQEQEHRMEQLQSLRPFSPMESLSFRAEAIRKIPPVLFRTAVKSMEEFHVKKNKDINQYLKQCVVGKIRHNCSENGLAEYRKLYPDSVKQEFLEVPYVIGRDHGIYQMFFYKSRDQDTAWQHFQTLCLAEMKLHEKHGYHLTVVMDQNESRDREYFLEYPIEQAETQQVEIIHPREFSGFLKEVTDVCKRMQKGKPSYKGIAFWNFPYGLTQEDIQNIYKNYNFLEECGVFFLFMVNDDCDEWNDGNADMVYEEMYALMKELPPVVYSREKQGYEANGNHDYVYVLEEYKNL